MTASKKSETPAPMASVATTTTQDLPDEAAKRARLAELDRLIADQEARLGQRAEAAVGATPAPFVFDEHATVEEVEHLARGQEEAVRQLNRDMANIESHQLAMWTGMPEWCKPPLAHFYRCGLRGPGKEGQRTAEIKARMMSGGWKPAPKGTRSVIWATDGEVLIRVMKGPERGPFGCQLQIIDIDRLWEQKNEALANGGAIHMGVEVDVAGKPVAYHIMRRRPSSWQTSNQYFEFDRIPAGEIIHVFVPEAAEQVRGVPWMYAALLNLVHMGAFEEAAVINARIGATQMGFITTPDGEAPAGDSNNATTGVAEFDAEPGTFRVLADGQMVESWQPQFPQAAVEPFIKAMLRGIASGLGVAYHNLASDLEGVNYSSARIAELSEREVWMMLQDWFIDSIVQPIYSEWLAIAMLRGDIKFEQSGKALPADKLAKFANASRFQGRRWKWTDPSKEIDANAKGVELGVTSRTRIAAEQGDDFEDVLDELRQETAALRAAGLPTTTNYNAAAAQSTAASVADPAAPAA